MNLGDQSRYEWADRLPHDAGGIKYKQHKGPSQIGAMTNTLIDIRPQTKVTPIPAESGNIFAHKRQKILVYISLVGPRSSMDCYYHSKFSQNPMKCRD